MTTILETQTYLPADNADLEPIDRLLSGHDTEVFALVGPDGRVAVPAQVHRLLVQVIGAMKAGRAITITPQTQRLTTQQSADLLGISRPTLVKLINAGEIACERTSSRRTLRLEDVMDYRRQRRDRQLAAIAETSTDLDDEIDESRLRDLLKEARAANARRRAAARS